MDPMIPMVGTVLVASLMGSGHCAGMCGGLLAFAIDAETHRERTIAHLMYHIGRGISYTLLGITAGLIGTAVDLSGEFAGLQRTAALTAAIAMIIFGLIALLRAAGVKLAHAKLPKRYQDFVGKGHGLAMNLPPRRRAMGIGLLTPMLPCGWLYMFVIFAAGTGSPVWGAAAMLAFWAGTLPVMGALGAGIQLVAGPIRARLPILTAILMVGVGVATATGRLSIHIDPDDLRPTAQTTTVPSSDGVLPCCKEDADDS